MGIVDIDSILNSAPKKRLIIGFDKLKENFNESGAREYYDIYKDQPLSFIIENSEKIFSEPYYGLKFYNDYICRSIEKCAFTAYEDEMDKLSFFIESYRDNMSSDQLNIYEEVLIKLSDKINENKNAISLAHYVKENVDSEFESQLSDELTNYNRHILDENNVNSEKILELSESMHDPVQIILYTPFIANVLWNDSNSVTEKIECVLKESANEDLQLTNDVHTVIACKKLSNDTAYSEAVSRINRDSRLIIESYAETCIEDIVRKFKEKHVKTVDTFYSSPSMAMQNIFENAVEDDLFKDEYQKTKFEDNHNKKVVYEAVMDMLNNDYNTCDDIDDVAIGYSTESVSIAKSIIKLTNDISEVTMESTDDADENAFYEFDGTADNAKIRDPRNQGTIINKIQNKSLDLQVKQNKVSAVMKKKKQDVANAAKAVTQIPENIINGIKDDLHKIDSADDDRRTKYITEPGFRKKAFKNLKLAILYGTAAQVKLTMLPVTMICRHYSKEKDRRIRNKVVLNLQTEIKVCEEKITDASAAGDNQEKYRLIRIKDQLDAEMNRVKMNSKYI